MSVTRPRLAVITLVASRFLLREDPPSKTSLRVLWIAVAVAIAATVATLAGAGSMAVPLSAVVASLVAVGMICVRVLMPAVAVAVFGMALGCAALTTVLAVTTGFERELNVRRRANTRREGQADARRLGDDTWIHPRSHAESRTGFLGVVRLFRCENRTDTGGDLRHLGTDPAQAVQRDFRAECELDGIHASGEQRTCERHGVFKAVDHENGDDAGLAELAGELVGHGM